MTDARQSVPGDRRPDWDDGQPQQQPHQGSPSSRKPSAPLNPWLTTLLVVWIILLAVAVIAQSTAGSAGGAEWDGNGPDPSVIASVAKAIAGWALSATITVFAIWVAVKAILWKAPTA